MYRLSSSEGFQTVWVSCYVMQQPQISSEATKAYSSKFFYQTNRKARLLMKGRDMTLKDTVSGVAGECPLPHRFL